MGDVAIYDGAEWRSIDSSGIHNDLLGRSVANTHPISSITDLQNQLNDLQAQVSAGAAPIGAVSAYAGTMATVPTNWLLCQGQEVSRTTYATLFTRTGSGQFYGTGNGSTTFNLPMMIGRAPHGYDPNGDVNWGPLGKLAGSAQHVLSWNEMPVHTHTYSINQAIAQFQTPGGTGMDNRGTNATTAGAGSGWGHNNMEPYIVLHWIIKAL